MLRKLNTYEHNIASLWLECLDDIFDKLSNNMILHNICSTHGQITVIELLKCQVEVEVEVESTAALMSLEVQVEVYDETSSSSCCNNFFVLTECCWNIQLWKKHELIKLSCYKLS